MSALLEFTPKHDDHFPTIGELITNMRAISPETTVKSVSDDFFADAQLEAVALVENRRPIGLVTRTKFLFTVFRQFGWEVYQRKPISVVADTKPLILPDWARLDVALSLALQRGSQDLYDEVLVVNDDNEFAGLLSVRQMVVQQTHALANVIVQKELAHERARELEEIGRIKSQFLANVTHELRSPVNAIIELAELMRIAAESGYVAQVRDRLGLLLSSATSLRSVITNMLDLSKIEAGRMRVIAEPFDLAGVLHEVAETTRVLLGGKPVEVLVSTEKRSVEMTSDPVKVRQIVLNLAGNAAKFTESGRIVIQQTSTADEIAIAVSDTGIGIRAEDLKKLFIAFSQLEDTQTKSHEGTGLGLAITKELTQMLRGRVEVDSELGRGSTFTIHLPKEISE
ncbi:MAG TPA: HAMP domain-containing sensor histidine kinase [Thermoanaerobaculia bacterium]|nr:HAMP domain-containing sensor histidine kinase [Thermoanaerobaculia bacterium]